MRWIHWMLAFTAGGLLGHVPGCTTSAQDDCAPGSEGCACTSGGECDGALECLSDLCVDAGGTSGDVTAGSMSSTSAATTMGTSMGTSPGTTMGTGPDPDETEVSTAVTSASSETTDGDTETSASPTTAESSDDASAGGTVEFHGNFLHNVDAADQCEEWNDFRATLVGYTFNRITMSGSEDPVGRTCAGEAADTICQAIFAGTSTTVGCDDGVAWSISDDCFGGLELDADNTFCSCGSSFAVRPCSDTNYWGGLDTDTCDTPSQSIDVVCEY